MTSEDLRSKALDSSHDFYDLLELQPSATESQIRTAYRRTALKYHPDKVGANDTAAREKFEILQIANEVLSDPAVRELYDNARRGRREKQEREQAYEGRRKWMKEDLERREQGGLKRKREDRQAEDEFERELNRIAEDTRRRRREREAQLRREAAILDQEGVEQKVATTAPHAGVSELDRSVVLRYPATSPIDKDTVMKLWEGFGQIEDCIIREKKLKKDGQKHRELYMSVLLVYKSILGAHAAISDFTKVQAEETDPMWKEFEGVGWASGKEPECIPKIPVPRSTTHGLAGAPMGLDLQGSANDGVADDVSKRKAPIFASFRGTTSGLSNNSRSPGSDEITMIRLKNAERRRQVAKIRTEEEASA
ncbi:hypothetical protein LTR62_007146 [Meristemomyces frigidus]|uniref:J domain-containing protein n=1 Tax=Meristemomyces frigidus TaxID=1508187 RepID=A0AAN7YDY3_9PEZI|nr:hypothetical protein LTR62_007146 [Meristemomyces frigidus]